MVKISCLLSNYNDAATLGEALKAILSQQVEGLEVIFVDDASTDDSLRVVESFQDTRIKIFKNECNKGVIFSALFALKQAQGDYIYFASANDRILPGFFSKALKVFEKYPKAGFFAANAFLIKEEKLCSSCLGWGDTERYFRREDLLKLSRNKICTFIGQSNVIRKVCLPNIEELSPGLGGNFDLFFFFAMAFRYGFYYSPEIFSEVTFNEDSFSGKSKSLLQKVKKTAIFINTLNEYSYEDIQRDFIRSGLLAFLGLPLLYHLVTRFRLKFISWRLVKDYLFFRFFTKSVSI